jgi:hypothetical protein
LQITVSKLLLLYQYEQKTSDVAHFFELPFAPFCHSFSSSAARLASSAAFLFAAASAFCMHIVDRQSQELLNLI